MFKVALIQTVQIEKTGRPEIGLGIAFIKSFLLQHEPGISVELFVNNEKFEQFVPLAYDMIGISTVSFCFDEAIVIAKKIKEINANIPVLIGGAHISALPTSIRCNYFDIGVIGEGEETFLELIRTYKKYKKFTSDILENIKGICFIKNGEVCLTEHRQYMQDLDLLPHFDKNFLKENNALPYLITSRGCPFRCKYCQSDAVWGGKVRFHSAEYIFDDILEIKNLYPNDNRIIFKDDNFTVSIKFLEQLKENKEKLEQITGRQTYFIGSTHVNFITHDLLKILKSLNVRKVNFGIETVSDRLLKMIRKSTTAKICQTALDLCYEYKIDTGSSFLIGLPEEMEDDLKRTYEFTLENLQKGKFLTTGTNLLTPLPDEKSDYWKIAVKKYNIDIHNFKWKRLDFRSFHAYYLNHGDNNSITDWWAWRQQKEALYIGALPEDKFLKIIEPYEKQLVKLNETNIKIDRAKK